MLCDFRIKVFYTAAVNESFTAAAKTLGITQPAVTAHIRELEREVGDRLFRRHRYKTVLTHKGEILFDYAERILHLYDSANRALIPLKEEEKSSLRILGCEKIAGLFLRAACSEYSRNHPEVHLSLETVEDHEEILRRLKLSEAELGFSLRPAEEGDRPFASLKIEGAARPLLNIYLIKSEKGGKGDSASDFLLCCKTL